MFWPYFVDASYLFVLLAAVFSMIASAQVNAAFRKYSGVRPASGMTGADAARQVLDANGRYDVPVERISGNLTDHYDPRTRVIRLSDSVYGASSVAAIGVAAHEAGHAVQHATGYFPLKLRNAIVPVTNLGSRVAMPLILLGLVFASAGTIFTDIAYAGVMCYGLCVIFQLVTLPTEFNASRRALRAIEDGGLLDRGELADSAKVLRAAAMTYVAALAVSITQFLRLLSVVSRSDRRRR